MPIAPQPTDGSDPGYGSRPVSIDLARSQRLSTRLQSQLGTLFSAGSPALRSDQVDTTHSRSRKRRLTTKTPTAPWPSGHRIFVCSIAGGVGRTTIAGLIATTVAATPGVSGVQSVALGELEAGGWSTAGQRWGAADGRDYRQIHTAAGWIELVREFGTGTDREPILVVDVAADLWRCLPAITEHAGSSVVVVSRPDHQSLRRVSEALAWLNDHGHVQRPHLSVVINDGAGAADCMSRGAATSLRIRAFAVHRLPASAALGPGSTLPSGNDLPKAVRQPTGSLCVDLHRAALRPPVRSAPPTL